MNSLDKSQLEQLINEHNVEDYSKDIREKKHSPLIKTDVNNILNLKVKYNRLMSTNYNQFEQIVISQCKFLHKNYNDIFNKVIKNEINLNTLNQLLNILKKIEDGDKDQHEASFEVGKLLKQIYIDGVIIQKEKEKQLNDKISKKKNKKKNIKKEKVEEKEDSQKKNLSWQEFKNLRI